ncbi:MAG: hypothetical protein ACREJN_02715, partial [Nitrospiraceae bacterium]
DKGSMAKSLIASRMSDLMEGGNLATALFALEEIQIRFGVFGIRGFIKNFFKCMSLPSIKLGKTFPNFR